MIEIFKIAFRNLGRHKRRTMFCIAAVFFAVFFVVIASSFFEGMIQTERDSIITYSMGHIRISTKEFEKKQKYLPLQYPVEYKNEDISVLMSEIKKIPEVKSVYPRIMTYSTLTDNEVRNAIVWGINFREESSENEFNFTKHTNGILSGRIPVNNTNECLIGKNLASKLKLQIGDKIPMKFVSSLLSDKFISPKIVGIFEFKTAFYDKNVLIMPFDKIQKIANLEEKSQTIVVHLNNPEKISEVQVKIDKLIAGTGNVTKQWIDSDDAIDIRINSVVYKIMCLIFLIIASFLIINTVTMAIMERYKEIGILSSMGLTGKELVFLFIIEGFLMGFIGALSGVFFGGILTFIWSLNPIEFINSEEAEFSFSTTMFMKFDLLLLFFCFITGVIVTSICSFFASIKTINLSPVEALRS